MSVKDDLIAARALIDTPRKWAANGSQRHGTQKLCAVDAICNVRGESVEAMRQALLKQLPASAPTRLSIATFNDMSSTTHADIMALFDRAIEAAS